jgi:hypothetical protein
MSDLEKRRQVFLKKIGDDDISVATCGTFSEEEWSVFFPEFLTTSLHVASHEIPKGMMFCMTESIKNKLSQNRLDFKAELRAMSNRYFATALDYTDEGGEEEQKDTGLKLICSGTSLEIEVMPTKKFMEAFPNVEDKVYSIKDTTNE